MDLIDRQAAIEELNEYFARIGRLKRKGLTKGEKAISLDMVGVIKTLPSVDVVRCKDCKYATGWTTRNGLYGGLTCESLVDMDVDEDFFCAFGEMKGMDSVK